MKKLCIIFSLCALMLLLASCSLFGSGGGGSGSDSAQSTYNKIDEKMNSLSSYRIEKGASLSFSYMGYDIDYETIGKTIKIDNDSEQFYYDEEVYKISSEALGRVQEQVQFNAYYNGYAFVQNEDDDFVQMLYSQMTPQEYEEFISEDDDIDILDCAKKQVKTDEDGSKMLVFSSYSKRTISKIAEEMGPVLDMLGIEVLDLTVTIKYDSEYRCTAQIMEFVFEDEETEFIVSGEYSDFNCAQIEGVENLDVSDFTYVQDLSLLNEVQDEIDELIDKDNGEFTLNLSQKIVAGGQQSTHGEVDNVAYGTRNGKFYYTIISDYAGTEVRAEYKNGVCTVMAEGRTQTSTQSEAEAIYYIEKLINTCGYQKQGVSEISKNGSVITVKCRPSNVESFEGMFTNQNGSMSSIENTITITLDGDEIAKIESRAVARGRVRVGAGMYDATFTVESELIVK